MEHYYDSDYLSFDSERSETWHFSAFSSEASLFDSTSREWISCDLFKTPKMIIIDIIYTDEASEKLKKKHFLEFHIGSHL